MTMVDQEFGTMPEPRAIRIERLLSGPIERVWAYLTEPEKRKRWLAAGPMALAPGGSVELVFHNNKLSRDDDLPPTKHAKHGEESTLVCVVSDCDPPRLLRMSWGPPGTDASEVSFELEPEGDRVRLTVTHRRLRSRDGLLNVSSGWHTHLALLIALLEGEPVPSFWSLQGRIAAEYDRRLGPEDH